MLNMPKTSVIATLAITISVTGFCNDGALQMTKSQAEDDEPCFSPDGKYIAFQSDRSGNLDIWVIPVSGGKAIQLTKDKAYDCFPSWSPDGKEIAFASDRSGEYDICVIPATGGKARRLTASKDREFLPSWSPDGKRIAFTSTRGGTPFDLSLWSIPAEGGEAEPIFTGRYAASEPIWSPDGKRVIFAHMRDSLGNWSVSVCSASPELVTGSRPLTDPKVNCYAPALSPDEKTIAFTSAKTGNWAVWLTPSFAKKEVQLTENKSNDCNPAWSPDGKTIAFASNRSGNYDIWTVKAPEIEVTDEDKSKFFAPFSALEMFVYFDEDALRDAERLGFYSRKKKEAILAAIEKEKQEEKLIDQSLDQRYRNDQASAGYYHETAQSFIPSVRGTCFKVKLYMTRDGGEKELIVTIREDDNGRPSSKVLGQTAVPHSDFTNTPTYSWITARFDNPPVLESGKTYWIYLPLSGRYHWGTDGRGGYPRGKAWSSRYDYSKYDWIFKTYMK